MSEAEMQNLLLQWFGTACDRAERLAGDRAILLDAMNRINAIDFRVSGSEARALEIATESIARVTAGDTPAASGLWPEDS